MFCIMNHQHEGQIADMKRKTNDELRQPRTVRSQQIKKNIYDTAINLLHDYGYEYVTVNNICRMAKISVGSFYHYFSGKDELLAGFFSEAFDRYRQDNPESSGDMIEDIIQYFCSYCDFCEEQGLNFLRSFYTPYNSSTSMMQNRAHDGTFASPAMNDTVKKLIQCKSEGILTEDAEPLIIANDLSIITKGSIYHWCISGGGFRIRDVNERLLRRYIHSYLAETV